MKKLLLLVLLTIFTTLKVVGAGAGAGPSAENKVAAAAIPDQKREILAIVLEESSGKSVQDIVNFIKRVHLSDKMPASLWLDTSWQEHLFERLLMREGISKEQIQTIRQAVREYTAVDNQIRKNEHDLVVRYGIDIERDPDALNRIDDLLESNATFAEAWNKHSAEAEKIKAAYPSAAVKEKLEQISPFIQIIFYKLYHQAEMEFGKTKEWSKEPLFKRYSQR